MVDDGLVRISVGLSNRKTSISMDSELYALIVERLGSDRAAVQWIEGEARAMDALETAQAKIGLSRLVQRQAVLMLLGKESPRQPKARSVEAAEGLSPALSTAPVDKAVGRNDVAGDTVPAELTRARPSLRSALRYRGRGRALPRAARRGE